MVPPPDLPALLEPLRRHPAGTAVLLDLDGTLAAIVDDPHAVAVDPAIRARLPDLVDRFGLVAFISGRAIDDLIRIVGLDGVAYSGNHGVELRFADGASLLPDAHVHERLHGFAVSWPVSKLDEQGITLEDKGATLTFHYRTSSRPDAAARYLRGTVAPAARATGLVPHEGRMSLEVHPPGRTSKGTAAALLLDRAPNIRHAISLGDDRTDTDIWQVLRDRVGSGRLDSAVAVGVTSTEAPDAVLREADALVEGIAGSLSVVEALLAAPPPASPPEPR